MVLQKSVLVPASATSLECPGVKNRVRPRAQRTTVVRTESHSGRAAIDKNVSAPPTLASLISPPSSERVTL
jgi:hypothetical protein